METQYCCSWTITLPLLIFAILWQICTAQDPCSKPVVIDEPVRTVANIPGNKAMCDRNRFKPNLWYSFESNGVPAIIPTNCVKNKQCGTMIALRLNMGGKALPSVIGETTSAVLCGSYNVLGKYDCCVLRTEVNIAKCSGDTYVYNFPRRFDRCPMAVCTIEKNQLLPELSTVKHGETFHESSDATHSFIEVSDPDGRLREDEAPSQTWDKSEDLQTDISDSKTNSDPNVNVDLSGMSLDGRIRSATYEPEPTSTIITTELGPTSTTDYTENHTGTTTYTSSLVTNISYQPNSSSHPVSVNTTPQTQSERPLLSDATSVFVTNDLTAGNKSTDIFQDTGVGNFSSFERNTTISMRELASGTGVRTQNILTDQMNETTTLASHSGTHKVNTAPPSYTSMSTRVQTEAEESTETSTLHPRASEISLAAETSPLAPLTISGTNSTSTPSNASSLTLPASTAPTWPASSFAFLSSQSMVPLSSSSSLTTEVADFDSESSTSFSQSGNKTVQTSPLMTTIKTKEDKRNDHDFGYDNDLILVEKIRLVFGGNYKEVSAFTELVENILRRYLLAATRNEWWFELSVLAEPTLYKNHSTYVDFKIDHTSGHEISKTFERFHLYQYFKDQANLTLAAECRTRQNCEEWTEISSDNHEQSEFLTLWKNHSSLLITLLVLLLAFILVVLLAVAAKKCLYMCSKHGTYNAATDDYDGYETKPLNDISSKFRPVFAAQSSPFTDAHITEDERLSGNGLTTTSFIGEGKNDIDIGTWVIPLDEAIQLSENGSVTHPESNIPIAMDTKSIDPSLGEISVASNMSVPDDTDRANTDTPPAAEGTTDTTTIYSRDGVVATRL